MKLSKKDVGEALREELLNGYNINRISNWAYDSFITLREDKPTEVNDILRQISLMDAGPEFEYTEAELRLLAELLITEEENPIEKLDELRSKNQNRDFDEKGSG